MDSHTYDLIVIGSGPAGQKAAICASKLNKNVAVVERKRMIGGVCLHTGTIPSKTLREAILYLSGFRQRSFYGRDYTVKDAISVADLAFRVQTVVERETAVIRSQLKRNGISMIGGTARFINPIDPHTIEVESEDGPIVIRGDHILVGCGTRPAYSTNFPIDGKRIFNSDQLKQVVKIPRELIVVGGGVIGLEYASMMAALNVEVTLIEQRPAILEFVDREIMDALCYHMRRQGAIFRLGEKVERVEFDESKNRVTAHLESGKRVHGDSVLYTAGRQPNSDILNIGSLGVLIDDRGRIKVNEYYQTNIPHIYAAGDVIGFPSLASSSMEQGRLAACHMFGIPGKSCPELFPYGIYTIPEVSMVGKTEKELTDAKIPYEIGTAKYEEIAKGQMLGDETGLLKMLFDPNTLKLLGVHIIGEGAAEIIHIGQAVLSLGATIEYFRDAVFNYPTLAEAYKVAALDGLNRL